ncbi:MAG: hypothetical protein QM753_11945 [Thermomicrobiales bacterium]
MPDDQERRCPICGATFTKSRYESSTRWRTHLTCSRRCGAAWRKMHPKTEAETKQADGASDRPVIAPVMDAATRERAIRRRDEVTRRMLAKYGPSKLASE